MEETNMKVEIVILNLDQENSLVQEVIQHYEQDHQVEIKVFNNAKQINHHLKKNNFCIFLFNLESRSEFSQSVAILKSNSKMITSGNIRPVCLLKNNNKKVETILVKFKCLDIFSGTISLNKQLSIKFGYLVRSLKSKISKDEGLLEFKQFNRDDNGSDSVGLGSSTNKKEYMDFDTNAVFDDSITESTVENDHHENIHLANVTNLANFKNDQVLDNENTSKEEAENHLSKIDDTDFDEIEFEGIEFEEVDFACFDNPEEKEEDLDFEFNSILDDEDFDELGLQDEQEETESKVIVEVNDAEKSNISELFANSASIGKINLESGDIDLTVNSSKGTLTGCTLEDFVEDEVTIQMNKSSNVEVGETIEVVVIFKYNRCKIEIELNGDISDIECSETGVKFATIALHHVESTSLENFLSLYEQRQQSINDFMLLAKGQ